MLQRGGVFIGRLLLAPKHHGDAGRGIELDNHVGALVGHPNIVLRISLDSVGERPGVEVTTDFANELAIAIKLEQLRCGRCVGRSGGVAA